MGQSLDAAILKILETKQPKSLKELILLVQEHTSANTDVIENEIKKLQKKRLIRLEDLRVPFKHRLLGFFLSRKNIWFWTTIGLTAFAFITILLVPEVGTPLSILRYAFAFVLASFLPGFCLTEVLFPRKRSMDEIERFTFSVGLSFAVTALIALFLSFTPFGFTLTTALISLGIIVVFLALLALRRKSKAEE